MVYSRFNTMSNMLHLAMLIHSLSVVCLACHNHSHSNRKGLPISNNIYTTVSMQSLYTMHFLSKKLNHIQLHRLHHRVFSQYTKHNNTSCIINLNHLSTQKRSGQPKKVLNAAIPPTIVGGQIHFTICSSLLISMTFEDDYKIWLK